MEICGTLAGTPGVSCLTLEGERIAAVTPASPTTAANLSIAPGFFDIQVNGYGGWSFGAPDATPETLSAVMRALRRQGVLFFCPTLCTDSREATLRSLRILARARHDPELAYATPCLHLEGPYIAAEDGPRGAHPLEHVRPPDWEEFLAFQDAAEGAIGIVTLAPEQPGALPFIERLASAGIVAALGHTGASPAQIAAAVRAGARLSTHLGNGSHARIDRHPNYIWEQLADDALHASLIVDGHHLPPSVVKCMLRAKGVERTILVSDSVAAAGLPPGIYQAQGKAIEILPTGRVQLHGTPYLAGSGAILSACIANVQRFAGVSLDDAVRAATRNPARLLGLDERIGTVAPGRNADLVLFRMEEKGPQTGKLTVEAVMVRGQLLRAAEMESALEPVGNRAW